jgi:hypothetical protein
MTKPVLPGDGKDWIAFKSAARKIEARLNVSAGRGEIELRGLCASGEVRSVRHEWTCVDVDVPSVAWIGVAFIQPSEWGASEVDFEGKIEVSKNDLDRWLSQKGAAQSTNPRDAAIERQLALKPRPSWKVIAANVCAECGTTPEARGYSVDRIKKVGLELLKRKAGHSG